MGSTVSTECRILNPGCTGEERESLCPALLIPPPRYQGGTVFRDSRTTLRRRIHFRQRPAFRAPPCCWALCAPSLRPSCPPPISMASGSCGLSGTECVCRYSVAQTRTCLPSAELESCGSPRPTWESTAFAQEDGQIVTAMVIISGLWLREVLASGS